MAGHADHQRKKVYDAEWRWGRAMLVNEEVNVNRPITINEARHLHRALMDAFGMKPASIEVNTRIKSYAGQYRRWGHSITFPRDTTTVSTLLHETAHAIDSELQGRGHGWSYVDTMMALVHLHYGKTAALVLRDHYRLEGIIFTEADEKARKAKLLAAEVARHARHNRKGQGFVLVSTKRYLKDNKNLMFLDKNPRYLTPSFWEAKVYRRQATAEKFAARYKTYVVVEVPVLFDAVENRWSMENNSQTETIVREAMEDLLKGEQS